MFMQRQAQLLKLIIPIMIKISNQNQQCCKLSNKARILRQIQLLQLMAAVNIKYILSNQELNKNNHILNTPKKHMFLIYSVWIDNIIEIMTLPYQLINFATKVISSQRKESFMLSSPTQIENQNQVVYPQTSHAISYPHTDSPSSLKKISNDTKNTNELVDPTNRFKEALQDGIINNNRGHWSYEQNKNYHWFLELHFQHFLNRHHRRMDKIFKSMEIFVGTRIAEQCRSHHQKMEKKYFNFTNIVANLRKQHYGNIDPTIIAQQMENSEIIIEEPLATEEELTINLTGNLKSKQRRKNAVKSIIKETKIIQEKEDNLLPLISTSLGQEKVPQQQKKEQGNVEEMNMLHLLQDSHRGIEEISLFHEKDEHNLLFFSSMLP